MTRTDLMTILACLESKEHNMKGRLDPRVPRDEQGRNLMTADELVERIDHIRSEIGLYGDLREMIVEVLRDTSKK